tara:strand:- start:611 stop:898 length:288 start_codon:yes stop_codon:yes gene_type:complete
MKKKELLNEALTNIREDRKKTEDLLKELGVELSSGDTTHSKAGIVAAKYVETLQRSNEQLVKIIIQISKEQKEMQNLELSDEEKENIFELIKETA